MDFKKKYLKYKNKYLNLKEIIGAGLEPEPQQQQLRQDMLPEYQVGQIVF